MPVAKEQIRQIISENNLNSVADIYSLLRDIHAQLNDLYGIELSAEMVSKITDKLLHVKEWQSRPLNPVYPLYSWTASITKSGRMGGY